MSSTSDSSSSASGEARTDRSDPVFAPIWANIAEMTSITPLAGVTMWPATGERLMINYVRLDAGAVIPPHHHHHEQAGAVLEGTIILTIGNETRTLRFGDAYVIPPHMKHGASTGPDGCLVIDVFSPPREDYVAPTDPERRA